MAATMGRKPTPLQKLLGAQARAAAPDAHVWLSASAGTGKTHVLTARVFRLLLQGVRPENILCLTFTKAGAAEMADRIHDRLAAWVQMDGPALAADLLALGEDHGPEMQEQARPPVRRSARIDRWGAAHSDHSRFLPAVARRLPAGG